MPCLDREQLSKNGFPPYFSDDTSADSGEESSSFVRIGSIDLSGSFVVSVKSRPLKREIASINYGLDAFDVLDKEIRNQSLENLASLGKRGCTTDELYTMLRKYFGNRIRELVARTLQDLSEGGENTTRDINRVVKVTKDSVSKYVEDAGGWTGDRVQQMMADRLDKWGKSAESLSDQQKSVLNFAKRFPKKQFGDDPDDEESSPT